ncbi:expansin-YoaJ-like [Babylonia areolata]|uniref:expansin-YoaJ-like n=1 Tax=Babylonia areolata TaxID=304850 RepID=UPI003FD4DA35
MTYDLWYIKETVTCNVTADRDLPVSCGVSGWSGVYTEVSVWNAGLSGRLCVEHVLPVTCGWELDIRFDPAIDRLDIWRGTVTTTTTDGSANIFRVVNKNYNFELTNNPECFDFNGYKSYNHGPKVWGRFARLLTGRVNQGMLDLYLNTYSGDGTYYGEGQEGTCTYHQTEFPAVGLSNEIDALAALNYVSWHNSKACGMCFKVTGKGVGAGNDPLNGEYIVFVKDLCPGCGEPGSVDFALNGDGRWDIEIQAVQCPVANNKLQYSFQGSNPWYLKLQVSNYRLPPNEVSIKKNGVWRTMTKTSDGYWTLNDGVEMTNTLDIPVRVTAINGEQLEDTIPQLVEE